jgi:hypothetical protein
LPDNEPGRARDAPSGSPALVITTAPTDARPPHPPPDERVFYHQGEARTSPISERARLRRPWVCAAYQPVLRILVGFPMLWALILTWLTGLPDRPGSRRPPDARSRTPGRAAQHPITVGHPIYRPAASNTADAQSADPVGARPHSAAESESTELPSTGRWGSSQAARHRRARSAAGTTLPLRTRPVP